MQIKVANEAKQDVVITGQNDIKNKINNGYNIKSIQRGMLPSMSVKSFTTAEKLANYQRKIASISPVDVNKSVLIFNSPNPEDDDGSPFIYYYSGTVNGAHEKLNIELKQDGIYTTPNKRDLTEFTNLRYSQFALSWQVVEFY